MGTGTDGGAVLIWLDAPGREVSRSALSGLPNRFENVREDPTDAELEEFEKDPPEGNLWSVVPGAGESRSAFAPASSNWTWVPGRHGYEPTSSWDDNCSFRFRTLLGDLQTCIRHMRPT